MSSVVIPALLQTALVADGRVWWLEDVARMVETLQQRWSLHVGAPFEPGGQAAWVAPARNDAGDDLVLKVAWRHPEAEHESDGLAVWNGAGAVRLHRVERHERSIGLLLERCRPGTSLSSRSEPEQDIVIARLLRGLWVDPPPDGPFRPLQVMCDQWADEFEQQTNEAPGHPDPGLARVGIGLFRSLPSTADRHVLLATDLHAGNVLAAKREPWLVIDPKPYVGDPTYDVLQHLLNCVDRLRADPSALVARMAGLTGVDAGRLRLWLFARCVQESCLSPSLGDVART